MILTRVTDAEAEALSLTDVKDHLRIDETDDHDVLLLLITAVRQAVEEHIERTLITSTWKVELDEFPSDETYLYEGVVYSGNQDPITLPMWPIQSIQSIQYYDSDDVQQTLSSALYEWDTTGRVRPVSGEVWPATYDRINAIEINYTAGYSDAGQIPENLRLAMRLMVGHYEKNREETNFAQAVHIPAGFEFLLNPFRIHRV